MSAFEGKKILVTGATGFIGGRIVEKLLLEHQAQVRALLRGFSRAARLARFDGIEMAIAPLTDSLAIHKAVEGCEVVFHCAYDQRAESNNIEGIRNLTDACMKHNVRLVHLSTISVYEPLKDGVLNETEKAGPSGFPYKDTKIQIEQEIIRRVAEGGLSAVILQPTIVYGPFGLWTLGPVHQLLSGDIILPDEGQGLCNQVYVDDVCEAMILSAKNDNANGETFLISGAAPVTWREFFEAYASILGVDAISYKPRQEIRRLLANPISNFKLLLADPKQVMKWKSTRQAALYTMENLPDWAKSRVMDLLSRYQKMAPRPQHLPTLQLLDLYSARCQVSIDKARRVLGYEPQYGFRQGMELTAQYIKWAFPDTAPRFN